jgi:hypothetical protein
MRAGVCSYCGRIARLTHDHIPPKGLFGKPRPATLITVPACEKCHSDKWSRDDEYFRLKICPSQETGGNPATASPWEAALRALDRPEAAGLRRKFINDTFWAWVPLPSGVVERRLAYRVDFERIFSVVSRIARGLHFHETGTPLPADYLAEVFCDDIFPALPRVLREWFTTDVVPALRRRPVTVVVDEAFWYRRDSHSVRDGTVTVWALTFYRGRSFVVATGPHRDVRLVLPG